MSNTIEPLEYDDNINMDNFTNVALIDKNVLNYNYF